MSLRVGFIGLGLMGNPMAKNIQKAGFSLTVYNRDPKKTTEIAKLGATLAKNPKDLANLSDVIITMVTAAGDVESVLFGPDGIIHAENKKLIVIDMSTIGPTPAKKIAQRLDLYSIKFIDAPVTGSTPKAISGELIIFIGAAPEDYAQVKPLLLSMGKSLHHLGPVGSGQAFKMVNNYLIASTIASLSESVLLADTLGISRKLSTTVLTTVPAVSPIMNLKLPNYTSNEFPLLFTMKNMDKDITLAISELKKQNKSLPILAAIHEAYAKAIEDGLVGDDFSAIIKSLEKNLVIKS